MSPYAEPQNMTGLLDLFEYANTVTDNIFGVGLLISLYIIVFGYLKGRGEETSDCFAVAGFLTTITAVFLFLAGLIQNYHLFIAILSNVLAAVWSYFNKSV